MASKTRPPIKVRENGPNAVAIKDRRKGRMLLDEKAAILRLRADGKSTMAIAEIIERTPETVRRFLNLYPDTTPIAEAMFRRGAIQMAQHVINKGSVEEHMDVLSRPNIGVLKPLDKTGMGGGGFSVQVSVGVASLGAMQPSSNMDVIESEPVK